MDKTPNSEDRYNVEQSDDLQTSTEISEPSEEKSTLTMNIPKNKRPPEFVFWMG